MCNPCPAVTAANASSSSSSSPDKKAPATMSSSTAANALLSSSENSTTSSSDDSEVLLRLTIDPAPPSESKARNASTSSSEPMDDPTPESQLDAIDDKLKRVSKYLHEIQTLSPVCEEASDDKKERQVFLRRILQVGAELQDVKDLVCALCAPPRLTPRQFDLLVSSTQQDHLLEFDASLDPSVRFFGVDWQLVFGKCFSLSLNVGIFRAQALDSAAPLDLVLVHSILKDLARVEVDVTSHGEAVMNGRLSKSQQRLIKQEQSRLTSLAVPASQAKVTKSRSFRESGSFRSGQRGQQQQRKYKKNKTTDFNRLTESASTQDHLSSYASERKTSAPERRTTSSEEWDEVLRSEREAGKRKSSFIQNVSSLFKNIR